MKPLKSETNITRESNERELKTGSDSSYPTLVGGCLMVDGYSIRIAVERGHLTISDGAGRERRDRRFPKVGHGIKRLIILGHSGTISLEAFRWLNNVGIHYTQLDTDGVLLTASADPTIDDSRLRRAQAVAHDTDIGHRINITLINRKLAGQARNARTHLNSPEIAERIETRRILLDTACTEKQIRDIESKAAVDYFAAWADVAYTWANKDVRHVPEHWTRFTTRGSLLSRFGMNATDPINATLNDLYALGEIECRRACLILGLDPGLGFLHRDTPNRDSLALDLLEAIRPDIDNHVLELADTHIFQARDFTETDDGKCRILPPLTHHLATTLPQWATAVAPWAEHIADTLADASPYNVRKRKTLTRANNTPRTPPPATKPRKRDAPKALGNRCLDCGTTIHPERTYCDTCWTSRFNDVRQRGIINSAASLHDPEVRRARGDATRAGKLAALGRQAAKHGYTLETWDDLAPRLRALPLPTIMSTIGCDNGTASRIRNGKRTANPTHWKALVAAVEAVNSSQAS
jgi:CRISPR-associated endonuclease Cas1